MVLHTEYQGRMSNGSAKRGEQTDEGYQYLDDLPCFVVNKYAVV